MLYWQKLDYKHKAKHNLVVNRSLNLEIFKNEKAFYKFEKTKYFLNI